MIEFLLGILSSIIGNLLTSTVKRKIGFGEELPPEYESETFDDDEVLERRRPRFRRQVEIQFWIVFKFFTLLFFDGAALGLPVAFKTGFFSHPLPCSSLRVTSWCDDTDISVSVVKILVLLLWLVCLPLVFFVAQLITNPLADFINRNWRQVDQIFYLRILVLTIMAITFILSGHIVYLLYPLLKYWQAVLLPFGVLALFGMNSCREQDTTKD